MSNSPNPSIQNHEPLRTPAEFGPQGKRFVAQLEEILDDIYRRFGRLKISDLGTSLKKTISDAEGNAYQAIQTANGFEERIKDAEGNASEALRTASSFEERIADAEGNASEALQTANGFEQRIQTAEGNASQALQTANSFESRVSSAEGNASSAKQTAKELEGKVVTKNGVVAAINASAEGVAIKGTKISLEGTVTANDNFQIQADGSMKCSNADMSGVLKTGNWTFDSSGSNYNDGSIGVNMTVLSGEFVGGDSSGRRAFYGTSGCDAQYGADYNKIAYIRAGGIKLIVQDSEDMSNWCSVYCRRSDTGQFTFVCGESEDGNWSGNIGASGERWDYVYTNVLKAYDYPGSSSRAVKQNIEVLGDFGDVIDRLIPVSYEYRRKPGDKRLGLIYEDTRDVLPSICLDTGDGEPGIRYSDLIAPMIKEIQSLRRRVAALESER